MELIIRNTTNQPIYDQIYSQIKAQIIAGKLSPGEALPSIRALAKDLRISVITTKRAYEELERDGLVYSQRTAGRFVTEDHAVIQAAKRDLAQRHIHAFLAAMLRLGYGREEIISLLEQEHQEEGTNHGGSGV